MEKAAFKERKEETVIEFDPKRELDLLSNRLKALEKRNGAWETPSQYMADLRLEMKMKTNEVFQTFEMLHANSKMRNPDRGYINVLSQSINQVFDNFPEFPEATFSADDSYEAIDSLYYKLQDISYIDLFCLFKIHLFSTRDESEFTRRITTDLNLIEEKTNAFEKAFERILEKRASNKSIFFITNLISTSISLLHLLKLSSLFIQKFLSFILSSSKITTTIFTEREYLDAMNEVWNKITEKISDFRQFLLSAQEWIPSRGSLLELKSAINSPNFSDLKIHTDGKVFFVHKAILSIRSPIWLQHLSQNLSIESGTEYVHINIPEDVLLLILEYLYTNQLSGLQKSTPEARKTLLEFSNTFKLKFLQTILESKQELKIPSILDDFKKLERDKTFTDVTFLCPDESGQMIAVHAHKLILCTKCQYFNAMLNSHMAESSMKEIVIQDYSCSQFSQVFLKLISLNDQILHFIYTDELDVKDPNDSVELLKASQHFFLNNLKKLCEVYIRSSLELETLSEVAMAEQAINAFQVARYHDADRLKEFAIKFILEYYDKFTQTEYWNTLDEESLSEINIWRAGKKEN